MSDTVIRVENLGKKYVLGHKQEGERYTALRDVIANGAKGAVKRFRNHGKALRSESEEFWALKDVSFEIKRGDRVGIIGRNGAGKSTLLKVLSRITEPTQGKIKITGRVASLLEVGTGFHPELTGRENISLNGAILGMSKAEIRRKFDEIVSFAEVEAFLDTPVKRYSSGMYVRLAFSVAAHLEPEVLVVDEVLAVGDLAFQKKCIGKMQDVSGEGRTVLFVSHNMQAMRALCSRGILLDKGQVVSDSSVDKTLKVYNQRLRGKTVGAQTDIDNSLNRRGSGSVRFTNICVSDSEAYETHSFFMEDTVQFRLSYQVFEDVPELYILVALRSSTTGEMITSSRHKISSEPVRAGTQDTVNINWADINIRPGEYPLYFWLGNSFQRAYDVVDDLTAPLVISVDIEQEELPFDPASSVGYFSVSSQLFLRKAHKLVG